MPNAQSTVQRLGGVAFPPRGRFALLHDPVATSRWTLILEDAAAFEVSDGLPATPAELREGAQVEASDIASGLILWDDGTYARLAAPPGEAVLSLHGDRLAARVALRPMRGTVWRFARLDAPPHRPLPPRVEPMRATTGPYPADEAQFAFEPKWDGVRAIVHVDEARVRVRSRNMHDVTATYPELATLVDALGGRRAVLDGEIVAFDESGRPSFQRIQARLGVAQEAAARKMSQDVPIVFVAFDVLHLDGADTTRLPYEERRALLESLSLSGPHVQLTPVSFARGRAMLATPGLEGLVAKRLGSAYAPGKRSAAWIKVKVQRRQEFVIGGWSAGQGGRSSSLGALLVGHYEPGRAAHRPLHFAGAVGTGFTDRTLADLRRKLAPLARPASPFVEGDVKKGARYVRPELVCEVEFTEWTREGRLRHPSFKGLRVDKDPRDVVREEDQHG